MAIRSIFAKVTAETSGFQKGMRDAAKSVSPFQQAMGGLRDFGKTLSLLRGGAALAGISIAANRFADFTGKLNEWADSAKRGQTSFEDFAQSVRLNLPIFGKITEAAINIDKLISPEKHGFGPDGDREAALERERKRNEERLKAMEVQKNPVLESIKTAREELNKLNLGERGAKLFDLRIAGAAESDLKHLQDTWDRIDWFKARDGLREARVESIKLQNDGLKAMHDRGQQLADSIKTPAMRFKDAADEVFKLLGSGAFGFGLEGTVTTNKLLAKLRDDIFPKKNQTFGREIDLSRESVGENSGVKKQTVEDVQLKVTNQLLREMNRSLSGGIARAA